ncbi:CRISPR-associated protein Cas5 [Leekyejoonella antrihumi]|uniref:Type I-E CRISPR-associated protein Cas5/CasD n=1 Tax=Leekyejoonella antrihumi TaxID=1660198 RepID=A0A563DRM1_9MICO|nr:CRISPR-associated protein Cas5 [Leekyejoonella antrihumi]TWP32836.1 hypothetical protein FGL98_23185 [Leekyejoonella antrihumi]
MDLVIRLASPIQTWAAYRVAHTDVAATPIPTKSGIAGLLAACIGTRDYLSLLDQFILRVRVDRTNAADTDLQVAVPPRPGRDTDQWHRSASLHAACQAIGSGGQPKPYRATKINITGGTNRVQYSPNRTFIPHAEFICHLGVEANLAAQLIEGFRRPVYTPYLGRMANPASFPFYLGAWPGDGDVLAALPYVLRHDELPDTDPPRALRVHTVTGGYTQHQTSLQLVTPPRATTRDAQLGWAKEHLTR